METALWTAQYIAAGIFLLAGVAKAFIPKYRLVPKMPWAKDFNSGTIRLIGVMEILGAIGLVLPELLDYAAVFTPLAAIGLGVVMLMAAFVHVVRREFPMIAINLVLLALTAFIAWGRLTQ